MAGSKRADIYLLKSAAVLMLFMFSACTYLMTIYFPRRRQLVSQLGYAELLEKTASGLFSGCRAWRMMNFRQRMGWIGVGLYLLASAAAFYYVFEINETYNKLALEHIQQHPKEPQEGTTWIHSLKVRLLSLPFWLWTIIFLIPYLQMFLFLYSCTRADPKTVGYCIIPICLAVICNRHQTFVKASNQISRLQLIDT